MRRERTDTKYVWDMPDAAETVVERTQGRTLAEYERTKWLRFAVERGVEIIGEAARRVSAEFKAAHPAVPWRPMIATRHIIAHEYADLQDDKVWRIAVQHVPAIIPVLRGLLEHQPPGEFRPLPESPGQL